MAVFEQERHVELLEETTPVYFITSRLVSYRYVGDGLMPPVTIDELPHADVFVMTIVTREDPKDDTLARVATVADLSELPRGRDAGLVSALGVGILYLQSSCTLKYYKLDEAIAAQTAVKDRVNALIATWMQFDDEFNAPDPTPATYILPSPDLTQLCALVEVYKVAKQDRYQKERTKTADTDAQTAAETDLLTKQSLYNAAEAGCALRTTLSSLVSAATTVLTDAQVALIAATQALTSAQATETAALNAVLALSPDFDKYTIPLVDDVPPGP